MTQVRLPGRMPRDTSPFNEIEIAELYAQHRNSVDVAFVERVAAALGPAQTVIDIGGGAGGPASVLTELGFDVVVLEPSPAMIAQGRARYPLMRYICAAAEDLPFSDASFDSAAVLYVLHHADDPPSLLAETRRVVRPDGRIVVASGNAACRRRRFFERYFPTLTPDLPDAEEIGVHAAAAGLRVRDVQVTDHWMYPYRTVDDGYLRMVANEMFSTLRTLNPAEYQTGLRKLREDAGRPIPPSRATLVTLGR